MDGYEEWGPAKDKRNAKYNLNFIGVASGYLDGHLSTITAQLYAASHSEAMVMFGATLQKAGMVNLSDYHVTKDVV